MHSGLFHAKLNKSLFLADSEDSAPINSRKHDGIHQMYAFLAVGHEQAFSQHSVDSVKIKPIKHIADSVNIFILAAASGHWRESYL